MHESPLAKATDIDPKQTFVLQHGEIKFAPLVRVAPR
jgi:hypothetical protein